MNYAPIALFVYKRPEHTHKALESLMQCPEFVDSPLYIFCDGAKKEEDELKVMQTRKLVRSMVGKKAQIIESSLNKGLAKSIVAGVTQLCEKYNRVIVLEDDLIVSSKFLNFLNAALDKYEDESSVMQISAYMFPVPEFVSRHEAIFLPFPTSWGWATWKRAWDYFDPETSGWEILKTNKQMQIGFNLDGSYDYFKMLQMQKFGKIDSWAIRWYWSIFKKSGYVLFPAQSYVSNIGFDMTGTHKNILGRWLLKSETKLSISNTLFEFPNKVSVDTINYKLVKKTIQRVNNKKIDVLINMRKKILRLLDRFYSQTVI
ncbi:MAG: glycosyltransferase family 2 protein [Rivularia sp. T60_A2020_040]|nr:glycosyltransferase family 2 protein [Rivularia sp. T60_A2020_040]